jgi:hypothetical protein
MGVSVKEKLVSNGSREEAEESLRFNREFSKDIFSDIS